MERSVGIFDTSLDKCRGSLTLESSHRIYLLDFILVEANAIKPANAQTETQGHNQDECSDGMPFQRSRNRARLVLPVRTIVVSGLLRMWQRIQFQLTISITRPSIRRW
jgi:hypothetical protein